MWVKLSTELICGFGPFRCDFTKNTTCFLTNVNILYFYQCKYLIILQVSRYSFQTVGPCDVRAVDLAGHERQVYLCKEAQDEDFTLVGKLSS